MTSLSSAFSRLAGGNNLWSYNWIFLVCWIVIIIAIIFYIYYVNRVFAFVFTKLLNFFLFKRFHVIVDIESLDISLLFGTIHFKNLAIITKDSTISLARGTFQWKFWMLRSWLSSSTYINKNLDQEKQQQNKIFFSEDIFKIVNESRNFIDIDGFEIFIYNNTNAYKHIFDTVLTTRDREILRERFPILEEIFGSSDIDNDDFFDDDEKRKREMTKSKTVNFENVYNVSLLDQLLDSFLPFVINIKKGSVVIGTPSTKYLLVMNWMRSQTLLHGIKSENSLDVYQIRLNTTHEHFLISLEPNPLYKRSENLVTTGFSNFFLRNGKLLLYFLSQKADKFTKHSERKRKRNRKQYMLDASKEWRGLAMYVNMLNSDGSNIQHQNNQIVDDVDTTDSMPFVEEYGKYSKLIECDSLSHVYYFDIPGYVPKEKVPTSTDYQGPEVGNSGSAPNMRLDILLANSQIFIGPWAYRNLMPIVTAMYPTHGRDLNIVEPLKSGDRRIVTRFRLFIDIQDDCTLRIPTREPSKDESFVSETENLQRNQMDTNIGIDVPFNSKLVRPYGWLDLDIKEGSSLFFDINYYPINGMHINSYTFELIEPSVTTSVNHEVAFTADFHSFIWEQNLPLAKNETRQSIITQITNNSKCNLLREHINLLVDLIQDFSIPFEDVPLEDQYQNFSPFVYEFIWRFKDGYDLVISSNDENIINIATESSENNFISFMGDSSELEVKIPMELFQPNSTTVDFKLNTRFFDILLTTPSYSTIKNFADNNKIGRGRDLEIIGYYEFFNELNFGNIDNLNLEFNSDQINVLFYGFVIKYFTNLYENLLGVTSKFKTAEEFQEEIFQNRDHLSDIFSNRSHFDEEDRSEGETINQLNSDNNSFEETESNSSKDSGDEGSGGQFTLSKEDLKRKENELDIFVKFNIGDANLYFPENIANIENSIGLHTQDLNIDIRALDYYFDLQIDAEPIYVKKSELKDGISSEVLLNNNLFDKLNVEETEGVLTYLNCHNHRFCAPPPIDDPYLTKWDFALGTLTLDTDIIFLKKLLSTVINFDFTLDDMDNMLVVDKLESYEVELDSFEIEAINIHLTKNTFTTNILLSDITFYYNEFETGDFSTKGNIQVDTLVIECFESCEKIFSLKTDLKLEAGFKYANYKKRQEKQKVLLIKNDSPFHRIWCLLPIEFRNYYIYQNSVGFIKPGQSIPSLPIPLVNETVDLMAEEYLEPDELKTLSKAEKRMQLRKNILTLEALDLNVIKPIREEETTTKNKKTYNIVFGTVLVDLDLAHLDFISLILDEVSKTDCESILDSVYADVVKGLYYKDKTQAVDKGYNIIIDGILFNINNSSFSAYEYLKINASALTIDLDVDTRFELQKNVIVAKVNKTLTVNTKKLSLNVHNDDKDGVDRQKNMRIVLESFDYELKNDGINSIKSFNFGTLSNHLNSFEFEIICELILQSLPIIDKTLANLKSTISNIQNRERELVLQLLIAGNQFDINYDPPVVSKLATIVRLSKTHVRENRSWRICARMRHIFNNLPDHWTEFFMEKVENNEFTPFEIASHQFFDCFKKWINIEKQVTDNTYLYKRLFLNENNIYEIQPEFEEAFEIFFKNIIIKIASDEEKLQDTLTLKDLSLTLSNEQSAKKTLKTEIGSLFGRLGSASLNLWSLKEEIFRENDYSKDIGDFSEVLSMDSNESTLFDFDASVSLQRMKLDLCLDEETLEIINHNTKINFSEGESSNMDINYSFDLGNFGFRKKNMSLFGSSISNLDVNYSKEKNIETNSIIHNIGTDLETLNFVTSEDTVKSIFIMESTWRSFTMQKHEFGGKSVYKPEKSKNKNKVVEDDIENIFNLSGSIKTLKTNSKFLKPLVFDSTATNLQWNVKTSDIAEIELTTQLFSLDISSLETLKHYMLFTENNLSIISNIENISNDKPLIVNLDLGLSLMKFMFSDIRSTGDSMIKDILAVQEIIFFIKNKLLFYGLIDPEKEIDVCFNTAFDIEYMGILFDFSSQQLMTELLKVTFGLKNYENIDALAKQIKNVLWYYGIDSFSVSLNDQMLNEEQSKIFDSSFSGYVSKAEDDSLLDLNLDSKLLKIMFTPFSFMKVLWFIHQFENFANSFTKNSMVQETNTLSDSSKKNETVSTKNVLENFNNINCKSANVSLGWIYSQQGNNENNWKESGIVYGYELLTLTHTIQKGEIKLENSFFGATPFSTSNTFQKIINSRNYINFCSLPLLSIQYTLTDFVDDNLKDLHINIHGNKLKIFLCENLMILVKNTIDSISDLKKLESRYINKQSPSLKINKNSETGFNKEDFLKSLGLHRIQCGIDYEGGYCSILSHQDFLNAQDATIFLHSPKIKIFIDYNFMAKAIKKHNLSIISNVDDSENLIYPTSVPILNKLIRDGRSLSESINNIYDEENSSALLKSPIFKDEYEENEKDTSFDFKEFLDKFELYFKVECGSQEVALTCEPKAKVEAILSVEKMLFKAETAVIDSINSISLFFDSEKLLSKFHHIFSNTISSYFQLSKFSLYGFLSAEMEVKEENFSVITVNSLDSHIDITQIQDLNLFFDIWTSNSNLTSYDNVTTPLPKENETKNSTNNSEFSKRKNSILQAEDIFNKYYTELTFAICFMFVLKDVKCIIDFGPALGCLTLTGTKLWLEFTQHSNWSKELVLHTNDIILSSVGRLQGLVKLKNFNFDSLVKFPTLENYSLGNYTFLDSIPLIKIDLTMESLKTSLSLDYHAFLLSEFADWRFSMSNEIIDKKPNLSITIDLEKIELYATALVTANLLSIYDSLEKIKLENLKSYYDILHDSNTVSNESVNIKPNIKTYLNALSKKVKVKIGDMYVQIAPHTLVYPQVLILENSNTIVNFTNYGYEKIFTEVEISTEKLLGRVTKSSLADLSEDDLKDISISAYQDLAKKSKGGIIVNFPSISTKMSTWKASGSNIIEFIYNSTFGGLVNIKWNLGPIGFISEIWTTHAIGLKQINDSRIEFTHKVEKDKIKSFFEEENLDERLKKMKLNDKYEYKPLVVPIIDTPNLKDLGNATPPLKWFGINKEKFPGIIYETISEPLQDLIKQLEKEYGKTLDKL